MKIGSTRTIAVGGAVLALAFATTSTFAYADSPSGQPRPPGITVAPIDSRTIGVQAGADRSSAAVPTAAGQPRPPAVERSSGTAATSATPIDLSSLPSVLPCALAANIGSPSAPVWVCEPAIVALPARSGAPARPATAAGPTGAQAATEAWSHQVHLPSPTLHVAPGEAMVGRLAYLEIDGPRTVGWTGTALGQTITIKASSTYDVDWGDGHTDTDLSTQGGPYPGGDITHSYTDAGQYALTVTQRWTASYLTVSTAGTIANVLHTEARLALPAIEVQATRDQ
jgi:hypothetical protein